MADKEIKEAKSLRWLANQFPKVENPKDNGDRLCNCINLYCTNAAELIERQAAEIKRLSTLAELGNTRANDYRVMRDRALKAEAENERLAKGWKADVILTANVKAEAVTEFAESLKSEIKALSDKHFEKQEHNICEALETLNSRIESLLKNTVS